MSDFWRNPVSWRTSDDGYAIFHVVHPVEDHFGLALCGVYIPERRRASGAGHSPRILMTSPVRYLTAANFLEGHASIPPSSRCRRCLAYCRWVADGAEPPAGAMISDVVRESGLDPLVVLDALWLSGALSWEDVVKATGEKFEKVARGKVLTRLMTRGYGIDSELYLRNQSWRELFAAMHLDEDLAKEYLLAYSGMREGTYRLDTVIKRIGEKIGAKEAKGSPEVGTVHDDTEACAAFLDRLEPEIQKRRSRRYHREASRGAVEGARRAIQEARDRGGETDRGGRMPRVLPR